MKRILIKDDDVDHINDWLRLDDDEKEFLIELAKKYGAREKRDSVYSLFKMQADISQMITERSHVKAFLAFILKLSAYVVALTTIVTMISAALYYWRSK